MSANPAPLPAWTSPRAYAALLTADPAVWAWEFARRARDADLDARLAAPAFAPCYVDRPPGGKGAPGVIWPWEADETLPCLSVRPAQGDGAAGLDIGRLDLPVLVVRSEAGDAHVLIADGDRRLRFAVLEGDVLQGPSACFASLTPARGGAASLEGLRQLMALQANGRLAKPVIATRAGRPKWLAALQAFDARRAGASQRDIACLLFGEGRVSEDWNGRSDYMRLRIHRLVRAAEDLVSGGYRRLFGLRGSRATGGRIVEVWRSTRWLAGVVLAIAAGSRGSGPGLS